MPRKSTFLYFFILFFFGLCTPVLGQTTPPFIRSLIANACGNEGNNEVFIFENGELEMNINELSVNYNGNIREFFTNDVSLAQDLNFNAACSNTNRPLFLSPPDGIIPPFARVMVFTSNNGKGEVYEFSNLCGSGPYYVFEDQEAGSGSQFADGRNGNCSDPLQFFTLTFRSSYNDYQTTVNWDPCQLINAQGEPAKSDGAGVLFDRDENTTDYVNFGCNLGVLLPAESIDYQLDITENSQENPIIGITWNLEVLQNEGYFIIEKSTNPFSGFELVQTLNTEPKNFESSQYGIIDPQPYYGQSYYRIRWINPSKASSFSKVMPIYVEPKQVLVYPNPSPQGEINIQEKSKNSQVQKVSFYNQQGTLLYQESLQNRTSKDIQTFHISPKVYLKPGWYVLRIQTQSSIIQKPILVN